MIEAPGSCTASRFLQERRTNMTECVFCNRTDAIIENDLGQVIYDGIPVSNGHLLVIPRRHVASWFEANRAEREALFELVEQGKDFLEESHHPDGYNIGINVGRDAGQSIFHLHIHLIPRYAGDIENPKGGVRGVIPHKRIY